MEIRLYNKSWNSCLEDYRGKVENYYNQILDKENGYQVLVKINNNITKQNKKIEKSSLSKGCEPVGDKSKQFYYRISELDSIDPSLEIFQNKKIVEELKEINAFYYYSMKLINQNLFYYFETKKMVLLLDKDETKIYDFYEALISIFIDKTDPFINKISNDIHNNKCKRLVK